MRRSSRKKPLDLIITHVFFKGPKSAKMIRMVVDTGATTTVMPPQVALAIGCDPAKAKKRIAMITASGLEYLPVLSIPLIESLGCAVRSLKIACHDLPPQSTVDGLLGLDFLSHVPSFRRFHKEIQCFNQE
jgi:predicted aspartyl protease